MSDTIPETVARVLDLDAKATPGPWNGATDETGDGFVDQVKTGEGVFIGMALHAAPSELGVGNGFGSPEWADNAALIAYYRTAAPALAREVQRLLGLLDALPASWRNLSDERNTARAECERLRAGLLEAEAERDAATARAERAEAKLAGQCETCGGEGVMYVEPVNGRGGEECVACGECLGTAKGWVAQAIAAKVTTERARVVEAIAAYVVHIAGREAANAMALGDGTWRVIASVCGDLADHIRSHNWAPPEENGDE